MKRANLYYQPSGRVSLFGILITTLVGIIAAGLLAFAYGYATYYIPFIYLNFLLTAGFGIVVGIVAGQTAYYTKLRSKNAVLMIGIGLGVIASYFSWVTWLNAFSGDGLTIYSPGEVFEIMGFLAEDGVWSLSSFTPTGIVLFLFWIAEAAIIIVATTLVTIGGRGEQPFCEDCEKWTVEEEITRTLAQPVNSREFIQGMENMELDRLTSLEKVPLKQSERLQVVTYSCPNCQNANFLTVARIEVTKDKDGDDEEKETKLVDRLVLDNQRFQEIRQWAKELPTKPVPDPQAKMEGSDPFST